MHCLISKTVFIWGILSLKIIRAEPYRTAIVEPDGPYYIKSNSYNIRAVTEADGLLLEGPQWSPSENVLYYVDKYRQKIYRYDPDTGERQERDLGYGPTALVIPIRGQPGILLVSVRTGLYLLQWGAPDGDQALNQITNVDLGKPDNLINDGKVDDYGNLWFGTMGKLIGPNVVRDKASLYYLSYPNFANPEIKIRPVSTSNGIAWSRDNRYMFYNDSPTRVIARYEFNLETGEIANRSVFFSFDDNGIVGVPDGMTIDADGNLWVATFRGASVLKIDSRNGTLLDEIKLPVDQVASVMWGGDDYSTLYVVTAKRFVDNPKPLSGALFEITNTGTRGKPEPSLFFPNAADFCT